MEYLPSYRNELYLAHHGIKGMRWGVRRYRNYDGTRTAAGKRRYTDQDVRNLQGSQKRSIGSSKNQQLVRKAAKIAAGTALAGAAGYALYKSGAGNAAIDAGKQALASRTGINSSNKPSIETNPVSNKHEASYKIKEANRIANEQRRKNIASDNRRKVVETAASRVKDAAGNAASKVRNAAGNAASKVRNAAGNAASKVKDVTRTQAKNAASKVGKATWNVTKAAASKLGATVRDKTKAAIRKRIMDGVDEGDPRTWGNAARRIKQVANTARNVTRAANKFRKGDRIGAVTDVSDELNDVTNSIVDGTRSRIKKIKDRRKRESK